MGFSALSKLRVVTISERAIHSWSLIREEDGSCVYQSVLN